MKMARFRDFKKGFELEETERPHIRENELLVRVKCCAVSGSDVYRYSRHESPVVMPFTDGESTGHEITGIVEETGGSVRKFKPGDRVVVQPVWGCGKCPACISGRENLCPDLKVFGFHAPGGFSEFITAREDIALKFEDRISFEEAVPTHHVATNLFGLKSSGATLGPETSAAVFGTGNLGLLMVMMLKSMAVTKIFAIDINPSRLALAAELAGSIAINASEVDPAETIIEQTDGAGADVCIELAGGNAPTINPALRATRKGGTFIVLAVRNEKDSINHRQILSKSLRIQGSATHTMKEMAESLAMIQDGRVKTDKIITHRFPLAEINHAFECRIEDPRALYVVVNI